MPNINIATCSFGSCTQYRFANNSADSNIHAFCQEGTFFNPTNNLTPHKSFVDWSSGNEHHSPSLTVIPNTLPGSISSLDGEATINIGPTVDPPSFIYSGSQIITSLASSTISTTTSGSVVGSLSAGIYELILTNSNGCTYTEYMALGSQAALS
ncbi:MAG: hypothetical protein IPL33_16805 [Sphingobacteriales bacterium]|nr:hypothetical protein [Sphingobacteriales bacterium]